MTLDIRYHRDHQCYYAIVSAGVAADGSPLAVAAPVTRWDRLLWQLGLGFLVKAKLRRRGVPI